MRTFRSIAFPICAAALLMAGCGYERDNPLDPMSDFSQSVGDTTVAPGIVLSKAAVKVGGEDAPLAFASASGDLVTFTVEEGAGPVRPGEILVNTQAPYFLKKVVRVASRSGAELVVETADAALTEVIKEATVEGTFSASSAGGSPKPAVLQEGGGRSINLYREVKEKAGKDTAAIYEDDVVTLSVSDSTSMVSIDPDYAFALRIRDRRVEHFKISVTGELKAKLGLRLEARGAFSGRVDMAVVEVPATPDQAVFTVGWVPVVIGIQTAFAVGAELGTDAAGTVASGIDLTRTISLGAEYSDGDWREPERGSDGPEQPVALETDVGLTGTAKIKGYVSGQINLKLYDVDGPTFELKPYLAYESAVDFAERQLDWSLAAGLDAHVGVQLRALDRSLEAGQWDFEPVAEWPLRTESFALTGYAVSGTVREAGVGLGGVAVDLGGIATATATTDADGKYAFADLLDGAYTLTPSRLGYSFSGPGTVTVSGADVTAQDFEATRVFQTYAISGRITESDVGLADVIVTLGADGSPAAEDTTDANGDYAFTDLPDGSYTVAPSRPGYSFDPPAPLAVALSGEDAPGRNFAATPLMYSVSGRVVEDGAGLDGVAMDLAGDAAATGTTDVDGNYSFADLPNGSYMVIPTKAGYAFWPDTLDVTVVGADATDGNFSAVRTHSISGRVTEDGAGLADVTMTLTGTTDATVQTDGGTVTLAGDVSATATTDADGDYTFPDLVDGSYTVTPAKTDYTFSEPRNVELRGGDEAGQDFTGTKTSPPPGGGGEVLTEALPGTSVSVSFVQIQPGAFTMGTTEAQEQLLQSKGLWDVWFKDERPDHQVSITKEFYLGQYEVTQAQWQAVMGTTPWSGQNYVLENPDHPAVFVSWDDVQGFLQELNQAAGSGLYRLPTEAEWEYACRAGTATLRSFGNDESALGDYAWTEENAWNVDEKYAHRVGTKRPNPWGAHDMLGNVMEWCGDLYSDDYYSNSPDADPQGPASGSGRVARGGYFYANARNVRSATRSYISPSSSRYYVGFRLLKEVE